MSYEKEVFLEFKKVFFKKETPTFSGLRHIIERSRSIGIYPFKGHEGRTWNKVLSFCIWLIILFLVFAESVGIRSTMDNLVEAVVAFLELVTLAMIAFKLQHYIRHADELMSLGYEVDRNFSKGVKNLSDEMKDRTRYSFSEYYIIVPALGYFFTFNLILNVVIMPAFYTDKLIFVASYPWDSYKSDLIFHLTYFLQGFTYSYAMILMSQIEAFGIGMIHYTNCLFEMLSDKMKRIGKTRKDVHDIIREHQYLIHLAGRVNKVYQPLYIAQVVVSLNLICLSGFQMVVALTEGNIPVFQRFFSYWYTVFSQIAFWCWNGNKIYWTVRSFFHQFFWFSYLIIKILESRNVSFLD